MRNFFQKLTSNGDKRRLVENFTSLSVLQGANYVLPLITIPYLTRVLGPEKYGLVAFALAFIHYFVVITDYGFNLTATREISIHRDQPEKISEIFSTVLVIRLLLCLLCVAVLLGLLLIIPKFRSEWPVYIFTFGVAAGNALFPLWFFQGMERMRHITVLTLISRLLYTISIFVFIREAAHYLWVPLLNASGFLLMGILGVWMVLRRFRTAFRRPTAERIRYYLRDGWHIFISQISTTLLSNTNTVILGILTTDVFVGYFAAGEKLIRAIVNLVTPVSNTIFPHVGKLFAVSRKEAFRFLRKIIRYGGAFFVLVSLATYIFAPELVILAFGSEFRPSTLVLQILALLPLTIFLNNIFGPQILINLKENRIFLNIMVSGGLLNLILMFLLVPLLQHIGSALASLTAEVFLVLAMYYFARRAGFRIW